MSICRSCRKCNTGACETGIKTDIQLRSDNYICFSERVFEPADRFNPGATTVDIYGKEINYRDAINKCNLHKSGKRRIKTT